MGHEALVVEKGTLCQSLAFANRKKSDVNIKNFVNTVKYTLYII